MFDDTLIRQLATELNQSEKARVQVEHFSKRFPGMTVDDGYRISRAWVAMKLAEGRRVIGHKIGLTYVSCSGPRIPVARLAAAQAAILEGKKMGDMAA